MQIVGITGLSGSGKSEIAKHLIEHHGFERAKFAHALKTMLQALLAYRGAPPSLIERMIEGDLKEIPTPLLNGKSPRHAMITLGAEWGRDLIDPNLWVDTEVDRVTSYYSPNNRILFDDVRFPNEVDAIRRMGGVIWRVKRPGLTASDHVSENLYVTPEVIIHNDGSLEELVAKIEKLCSRAGAQS